MKKNILSSYVSGIIDKAHGESIGRILRYLLPEFVTALLLTSLPFWLDAAFIGQLKSTSAYATVGVTGNLIHLIIKSAEAFSVGTVILTGQFNGRKEYREVGYVVRDAFWTTCCVGLFLASFLYLGAPFIYTWYGVTDKMLNIGVPFLRLRAFGVVFMFIFLAFVGFLRGIKNTKIPMAIFIMGSILFVGLDYSLIFGKFGFPEMGLIGSAYASIAQYVFMLALALGYILLVPSNRKFGIHLFTGITNFTYVKNLFSVSWPIILDKATMACAYIWLCKMFCTMGKCATASFCVVKDMERFAILPAIAGAQVITFLVSNDLGKQNFENIKSNIKKMVFVCSILVFSALIIFSLYPMAIISFFDKKGGFSDFAVRAFPLISVLAFFDVLQLVLAGALRGSGNVRIVMMVRILVCLLFFVPVSYMASQLTVEDPVIRFVLVYGSFYVGNGIMSLMYIRHFRSEKWKQPSVKGGI